MFITDPPFSVRKRCVCEGVPSKTVRSRKEDAMKKSYPGVNAERVECTPEETIRLQEMNDSEMLEFLHRNETSAGSQQNEIQ